MQYVVYPCAKQVCPGNSRQAQKQGPVGCINQQAPCPLRSSPNGHSMCPGPAYKNCVNTKVTNLLSQSSFLDDLL